MTAIKIIEAICRDKGRRRLGIWLARRSRDPRPIRGERRRGEINRKARLENRPRQPRVLVTVNAKINPDNYFAATLKNFVRRR